MTQIYSPLVIRKRCWQYIAAWTPQDTPAEGYIGASIGMIEKAVKTHVENGVLPEEYREASSEDPTATNRYMIYGFLFTPDNHPIQQLQTGDLSDAAKYALYRWVRPSKTEETPWMPRIGFVVEAQWVLNIAKLVLSWTKHYHEDGKEDYYIYSFLPAIADRLEESIEAEDKLLEPVGQAIALGGMPVQQDKTFLPMESDPPAPVVKPAFPKRVAIPPSPPLYSDADKEKMLHWVYDNGGAVGMQAYKKNDAHSQRLIAAYKKAYVTDSMAAWVELSNAIREWQEIDELWNKTRLS